MNKKVALAHDHLFQFGGAERVLLILSDMQKEAPIYTLINDKSITKDIIDQSKIITSGLQKIPGINKMFRYFLLQMPKHWEKTDLSNYDLVISSSSGFVKGAKTGNNTKHICYCHAPTRYLWDNKEEYIDKMPEGKILKIFLPKLLDKLQLWDFSKAQDVDFFIANSQYIADKIAKHYKRDSVVIHPPVRVEDFSLNQGVEDYYLIVSRLRPYKKVDLAIKAFNNLKLPLKIIGSGSEFRRLKNMARSNIEFLGEVSDEERNDYLSKCKAFIYPQIEDFGISALEAMASGRPVIAYKKGGALETVIEGISGTFFEEQTWESLAHKILRFDADKYDAQKIREHAKKFDESVFRQRINDFVNSI